MKICFIIPSMTGGGAERVTANLANRMDEMGHEVRIMMTSSDDVAYKLNENVYVFNLGYRTNGSLIGRFRRITSMRRYFKKNKDMVFVSMETATNMFAILSSLFMPINLIVSERSNPKEYENQKLRDLIYCFANKIVFQTEDAKKCFSKRLQSVGTIIGNPVADRDIAAYQGMRTKRFVAVGRLEPVKNYPLLISAFAQALEKYPEYTLHFHGKGDMECELRKFVNELNISENVRFEGFCENVPDKIRDATAYILSSDYEGISNSLLEAMAMGLPVISTDCPIGGSRMLITHMENGLLIPVGDKQALVDAMSYIVENPGQAKRMSDEAQKVKDRFSVQRITEEWLQYMKE